MPRRRRRNPKLDDNPIPQLPWREVRRNLNPTQAEIFQMFKDAGMEKEYHALFPGPKPIVRGMSHQR